MTSMFLIWGQVVMPLQHAQSNYLQRLSQNHNDLVLITNAGVPLSTPVGSVFTNAEVESHSRERQREHRAQLFAAFLYFERNLSILFCNLLFHFFIEIRSSHELSGCHSSPCISQINTPRPLVAKIFSGNLGSPWTDHNYKATIRQGPTPVSWRLFAEMYRR